MSKSQSTDSPAPEAEAEAKPKRKRAPNGGESDFVSSYIELGARLFTHREAFSRWKNLPGAPDKKPDGRHSVSEWRAFMAARGLKMDVRKKKIEQHAKSMGGGSPDEPEKNIDSIFGEALKDAHERVKIRERELKMSIKRGEYVASADVKSRWAYHVGQASTLLRKKLEDELPPILAGLDGPGIRKRLAKVVDEFTATLHAGT